VAYLRAQDRHQALKYSAVGIMVTAVIGFLLFLPVVQGVAQNKIASATMQVVVGEVVSALLRGYAVQSLLLFFIGLILFAVNHHNVTQSDQAAASPFTEPAAQQPPAATDEASS
jgi:cbb3-type cytochrome oxidase subunit 3